MTPNDRAALAQILALPDGPWEWLDGCPTWAQWIEDLRYADSQQPWNRPAKQQPKAKAAPKAREAGHLIK